MRKRRTFAVAALVAAVLLLAGIAVALGSGGSSPSRVLTEGRSVAKIRARNLRLETIRLLLERQGHGVTPAVSVVPGSSSPKAHSRATPIAGGSPAPEESSGCDPNYEGACLNPSASDYDCEGGTGDGPEYTGEVMVIGEDHFGLDADGDGVGCEPAG